MFEIKLIICIKMDLALNNLQMLICHKTQTTNHLLEEKQSTTVFLSLPQNMHDCVKHLTITDID